jgi:hypothetical protein
MSLITWITCKLDLHDSYLSGLAELETQNWGWGLYGFELVAVEKHRCFRCGHIQKTYRQPTSDELNEYRKKLDLMRPVPPLAKR